MPTASLTLNIAQHIILILPHRSCTNQLISYSQNKRGALPAPYTVGGH
jgi:hypothetical protein